MPMGEYGDEMMQEGMYGDEMEQMVDEDGNPIMDGPMEGDGQQYEEYGGEEVSESGLIQI